MTKNPFVILPARLPVYPPLEGLWRDEGSYQERGKIKGVERVDLLVKRVNESSE